MTSHYLWNEHAELMTKPLAAVLMDLRREDGDNDLLMDAVTLAELTEEADRMLAIDGVVAQYNQIERVAGQMEQVMRRASGTVKPVAKQISDPFTQYGALQVVVLFELSDGQTISIYFHNPDTTPKKIAATDELVSWKWLLNKKDVTILVAPEQGRELNAREVARRIMKAAEKNSAAFVRNNAKRAERLQAIEAMKTEIGALETECKDLERQIEEARLRQEEPEPVVEPDPVIDPEPAPDPTGEPEIGNDEPLVVNGNTYTALNLSAPEAQSALNAAMDRHQGDLFAAAKDVYQNTLLGHYVKTKIGPVLVTGGGWREMKQGLQRDDLRARTIPFIPVVLRDGDVGAPEDLYKARTDGTIRFHPFTHAVDLGDVTVKALLKVAEREDHSLVYYLTANPAMDSAQKQNPPDGGSVRGAVFRGSGVPSEPTTKPESTSTPLLTVDSTIGQDADGFNLVILEVIDKATGERREDLEDFLEGDVALTLDPEAIARVDAAYRFENATDEFKAWVADNDAAFATARAMEERAKTHGATIEWGLFDGAALDAVYVEEDDEGDVALDSNPNWDQQPRDRKTGRWVLRRMKRLKQAAKKAGETVANAARKAGDYVAQALKGGGKSDGKSAAGKLAHGADEALEGGAKVDPGLAAINEIVGGAKAIKGAFDSAVDERDDDWDEFDERESEPDPYTLPLFDSASATMTLDGVDQSGYVGKIRQGGEIVGRVDMGDDGKAMVFVGANGDIRVSMPGKPEIPVYYSDSDAPDMVDWLFNAEPTPEATETQPDLELFMTMFNEGNFRVMSQVAGYAEAAKTFLEGDLEGVKIPKKYSQAFDMSQLRVLGDPIKPKPISRKISIAKTPEAQLKAVMKLAGKKDVRYYLNGVKVEDGRLVATDGHRLVTVETDTSAWDHLRPQIADKDPDTYYDDGVIVGRDGKLIDESFPDVDRAIPAPKSTDAVAEFDAEKLAARARGVIKASKLTDQPGYTGLILTIGGREIGFNADYLLDMAETFLRFGYKTFAARGANADSPLVARSPDGKVTQALMPMRVGGSFSFDFAPLGAEIEAGNDQAWGEWANRAPEPEPQPQPAATEPEPTADPEPTPEPVSVEQEPIPVSSIGASFQYDMGEKLAEMFGTRMAQAVTMSAVPVRDGETVVSSEIRVFSIGKSRKAYRTSVVRAVDGGLYSMVEKESASYGRFNDLKVSFERLTDNDISELPRKELDLVNRLSKDAYEKALANEEQASSLSVPEAASEPEPTPEPIVESQPEPTLEPPADPQKDADRALFQSVIDGAVPDILSPDLGREMIAAYERNQADAELIALAEQAMDLYEQAMLDAEIPQ